jgi:MFS family permease
MKIYLAFLVVLCNMLSWQASKLLTSLFAINLGATQLSIGMIIGAYSLFPMLLAFYAGKLSDRLGVRMPMLCGTLGVVTGIALPWAFPMLSTLYVSGALIGASHVFYNVSIQSLIGSLSTDHTRQPELQ